jgi:hypothetical protein
MIAPQATTEAFALVDAEAQNSLLGKWLSPCIVLNNEKSLSGEVALTFQENKVNLIVFTYAGANCRGTPMESTTNQFSASYAGISEQRPLPTVLMTLIRTLVSYDSDEAVAGANSDGVFGIRNWIKGEPIDVTERFSAADSADKFVPGEVSSAAFNLTTAEDQSQFLSFADETGGPLGLEFNTRLYFMRIGR